MQRVPQAGAIAVRTDGPVPEFLVVTAKQSPEHVIFPKGHIEPGETSVAAALRELREEAGVDGEVIAPIGTSAFRSGEEEVEVTYYLIRYMAQSAADEGRQLRWLPYQEAREQLSFDDAKRLLDTATATLKVP